MFRKKLLGIGGAISCIVLIACFIAIYKNTQPLVDDYGQELTPIADVGIETTFLELFDNCVLPNGEPCTLESMDPLKVSFDVPSYENVKPTFPLLLATHENEQRDILYDIFLFSGYEQTAPDIPEYLVGRPYVIITKNCCPLCSREKLGIYCNAQWCYFVADSADYPGKYTAISTPFFVRRYTEKDIVKDDILQYAFLFPDGVTMDNLRKIILEVREFGDTNGLLYMSINKEDLELRNVYEKELWK